MPGYQNYQAEVSEDINRVICEMGCQPILFIGSGFSKRFFGAPNWSDLLDHLQKRCPLIPHEIAYYIQEEKSLPEIGGIFSDYYREWAWSSGPKFDSGIAIETQWRWGKSEVTVCIL